MIKTQAVWGEDRGISALGRYSLSKARTPHMETDQPVIHSSSVTGNVSRRRHALLTDAHQVHERRVVMHGVQANNRKRHARRFIMTLRIDASTQPCAARLELSCHLQHIETACLVS